MPSGGERVIREPVRYEVGVDIEGEKFALVLAAITDWYSKIRSTKEPGLLAKQELEMCLKGIKKDGQPWRGAARSTLEARVRIMCRFDIATMKPLENASDKQKQKKEKEKNRLAEKRKAALKDDNIPDEVRKELESNNKRLRSEAKYGDDPTLFMTSSELRTWNRIKDSYKNQFPEELGSVSAEAELDTLCDLHILNERHRLKMFQNQPVDPIARKTVVDQLDKLKTMLGIHPNQLAKRVKSKADTTIAAAALQLTTFQDWRKLRLRFFAEEMLQLWQMYQHVSADGLSYQIDEIGFFSATRCRTCACSHCGTRNAVGFSIDEIEAWLKERGIIRELAPEPDLEPDV